MMIVVIKAGTAAGGEKIDESFIKLKSAGEGRAVKLNGTILLYSLTHQRQPVGI